MSLNRPDPWTLRVLETPEEIAAIEDMQRLVWPGSETDVVPLHILITIARNGGLVFGAFDSTYDEEHLASVEGDASSLIGFVYGFPGLYFTPDGPRPKHCSHQLGVRPNFRGRGLGFALKRAQWQMVRHQGLDLITWTFDPLVSRNAYLNIARLGAVCNTYLREIYGELKDDLNRGLLTDRFRVDWWVNTRRVERRLSRRARLPLDLAHFLSAEAEIINPTEIGKDGLPRPASKVNIPSPGAESDNDALLLVEIPSNYHALLEVEPALALEWRLHTRPIFEELFERGYLVTDFVHLPGNHSRSFYILSHGESTL